MRPRSKVMVGLLGAVSLGATVALAQAPAQNQNGFAANPYMQTIQPVSPDWAQGQGAQSTATKLAKDYAKSEKDDEKKELRKKLQDLLAKQFDQHMEQQQKELKALENQIENLKTLMKKRSEAKTAIVDRRMDQLIQDAQGLGWSGPSTGQSLPGGGFGGGAGGGFGGGPGGGFGGFGPLPDKKAQ
jgi:flagellar motility protein MotE (MotC chaperone)